MSRDTGLCPRKTPQWPLLLPQPGLPRTDKLTLHVWAVNSPGSRLPQSRRSASGHPSSPPRTHWVSLPATSSAPKGTCRLSRVRVFQAEQRTPSCPALCPFPGSWPLRETRPNRQPHHSPLLLCPDPREEASVPPPTAAPTVPALGGRGLHQTPGGLSGQGGGWEGSWGRGE